MWYLDTHAASPVCDAALMRMRELDESNEWWANPASVHTAGRVVRRRLEQARDEVSAALKVPSSEFVFTSGGTEACNQGLLSVLQGKKRLILSSVEHPAVSDMAVVLRDTRGVELIELPVFGGHPPEAEDLALMLDPDTAVAIQWVNHETGTIFPIRRYAEMCSREGASLFVDACQAFGKIPLDLDEIREVFPGLSALAVGSSKIGGPGGVGGLWARRELDTVSVIFGGGQEKGRRAGLPDVRSCVGFGAAACEVPRRIDCVAALVPVRDYFAEKLTAAGGVINASEPASVPTVVNVSFLGMRSQDLVAALDLEGVCVASGAACSSGLQEPSRVIGAMYPDHPHRAEAAVRFSFGPEMSTEAVDEVLALVTRVLAR